MNNWQYGQSLPTHPWRGQMGLPRRLSLVRDAEGVALQQVPLSAPLRQDAGTSTILKLVDRTSLKRVTSPFELVVQFPRLSADAGVRLYFDQTHFVEIGYKASANTLYVDRTRAGLDAGPGFSGRVEAPAPAERGRDLRVIVDRSSVEVFGQGGTVVLTDLIFPPSDGVTPELFSEGGQQAIRVKTQLWQLKSIWK